MGKWRRHALSDAPWERISNLKERCIGWFQESRRIATRFEKLSLHFLGMLKLAIILEYLESTLNRMLKIFHR